MTRKQIAAFFGIVLVLCTWHLDTSPNDNTMSRALTVMALADHGTLDITTQHERTGDKARIHGRYYSDKAPLPTFVVLPFWWLARALGADADDHALVLAIGGIVCGSLPLAIIITLTWLVLMRTGRVNVIPAALIALLPFLGSFLFVYSGSFYNHLLGGLLALLAARSLQRQQLFVAGCLAGAAFLCESAFLLFAIAWAVQAMASRRKWWLFLAGLLPGIGFMALNNVLITGSPWAFPNAFAANYAMMHSHYGFGSWRPDAWWGLSLSPYRGLLFFAPALAFGVVLAVRSWRSRSARDLLLDPLVIPALALTTAYFTSNAWNGGWAYGPRYLTAPAILLLFATLTRATMGTAVERIGLLTLSGFGLLCAVAAKSTVGYALPTGVEDPLTSIVLPALLRGEFAMHQWPVALGASPGFATAIFLFALVAGTLACCRLELHIQTDPHR